MEIFLYITIAVFAVVGFANIFEYFSFKSKVGRTGSLILIAPLSGENAEIDLRAAMEYINFLRATGSIKLIAVDVDLNDGIKNVIQKECDKNGINLISINSFDKIFIKL